MKKYVDKVDMHLGNVSKETEKRTTDRSRKAAISHCKVVVEDLKVQWPYYENFKISDIGWSIGDPVNTYSCTVSATRINVGSHLRKARIEITQRFDSKKFIYRITPCPVVNWLQPGVDIVLPTGVIS